MVHGQLIGLVCVPSQFPQKRPINFFLSTLLYTDQPTQKTAPTPVACLPFQPLPFQRSSEGDSPLPKNSCFVVAAKQGQSEIEPSAMVSLSLEA